MGFFGALFFLIFSAIVFIFVLGMSTLVRIFGGIGNLWNFFTGRKRKPSSNNYYSQTNGGSNSQTRNASANQSNRPHSTGVFGDDEGTYVDFEEIK